MKPWLFVLLVSASISVFVSTSCTRSSALSLFLLLSCLCFLAHCFVLLIPAVHERLNFVSKRIFFYFVSHFSITFRQPTQSSLHLQGLICLTPEHLYPSRLNTHMRTPTHTQQCGRCGHYKNNQYAHLSVSFSHYLQLD